jgi:hypothetical protein
MPISQFPHGRSLRVPGIGSTMCFGDDATADEPRFEEARELVRGLVGA